MLNGLLTKVLVAGAAFIYPGYASFKALSQSPVSQADLERWLMYWSVLGCIGGVEYAAEWILSWIPFYYSLRMTFLLYLLLPQTNGATYVYKTHLEPFLKSHEADVDAWYLRYKTFAYNCVLNHFHTLWKLVAESLKNQARPAPSSDAPADPNSPNPPPLQTVASALVGVVGGLCKVYGPTVLAIGTAVGKQLGNSIKTAVVSVAAQADAALAAAEAKAAEGESTKFPVAVDVVPVLEPVAVVETPAAALEPIPEPPKAPELLHVEIEDAPEEESSAPADEPTKAPDVPAMMAAPQVQQNMYFPEPMAPAQSYMPFPNIAYLPQMLPERLAGDGHFPSQQVHTPIMTYPPMPFLSVSNTQMPHLMAHLDVPSSELPVAEEAAAGLSDAPVMENVATQPKESTEAPAAPPVTAEAPKEMPPPPPPTAAAHSSEAPPVSAHAQPVLMPLLWVPPSMS
ncbi:hypothetical protein SCHPADRAFT_935809 [Schizopora paradoxa]|uniref:Protein YOP1 n=1 Tax=Schizopora paradoxa TaxID=27342 RepID=A0A0H2SPJ2_9AGAM|nr:hypothetical protein SCHPADRAFT_935809 [Schizopora paradoxa]